MDKWKKRTRTGIRHYLTSQYWQVLWMWCIDSKVCRAKMLNSKRRCASFLRRGFRELIKKRCLKSLHSSPSSFPCSETSLATFLSFFSIYLKTLTFETVCSFDVDRQWVHESQIWKIGIYVPFSTSIATEAYLFSLIIFFRPLPLSVAPSLRRPVSLFLVAAEKLSSCNNG